MYTEKANAKINLHLDVTSLRDDGFHDIVSLMHSVELSDMIFFDVAESPESIIALNCSDETLPNDESNLVYRAAKLFLDRASITAKLDIFIDKKIPIGAGLGGGSSDAAAILRGLNKIFASFNREELLNIAAELGSDVPFCLIGGTAICTGRGENMTEVDVDPHLCLVIAKGQESVSTPKAYRALDEKYNSFLDGSYHPRNGLLEKIIDTLREQKNPKELYNIFEQVTDIDDVKIIKEIMIKNKAEVSLMSGSGPSVFGIFPDAMSAFDAMNELEQSGYFAVFAYSTELKEFI